MSANAPTEVYRKAQALSAEGKHSAALIAFEEAFRQEPGNFRPLYGVGLMHQQLEDHEMAVQAFSQVIRMQPRIPQVYCSRAHSFQKLKAYTEALADGDAAVGLDPAHLEGHFARGIALRHLERIEEAVEAYDATLSLGPYPAASRNRATLRYFLEDYVGAADDITTYIGTLSEVPAIEWHMRGVFYCAAQQYRRAVEDFTRAIDADPREVGSYFRRNYCYKELGETEAAAKDWKIGMKLLGKD